VGDSFSVDEGFGEEERLGRYKQPALDNDDMVINNDPTRVGAWGEKRKVRY
jgi:hypothetical protein